MVVLVAGASGGLGSVLAGMLKEKGMTVYGTCRNPSALDESYPFPFIAMDITDEDSVAAALSELVEKEGRIDAAVNCVNEMFIGSVAEASMPEVVGLYDTNVFGAMRLCRQLAPIMKAQADGGTIVIMSSLGGILAVPFMSSYTSAKFALEAFAEAFRHEVKNDNVRVSIMQPVAMHMERGDTGSHLRLVDAVQDGSLSNRMLRQMSKDTAASKLTPEIVSKRIIEIIESGETPLRVPMDRAKVLGKLKRFAPQAMLDKMVRGLVGLDKAS